MSVLPNYLLTFKSDIHKGMEQDSHLWVSESFFKVVFFIKRIQKNCFSPQRKLKIIPGTKCGVMLNTLICYRIFQCTYSWYSSESSLIEVWLNKIVKMMPSTFLYHLNLQVVANGAEKRKKKTIISRDVLFEYFTVYIRKWRRPVPQTISRSLAPEIESNSMWLKQTW